MEALIKSSAKLLLVLVLLLAGCASVNNAHSPARSMANNLDEQDKWLHGLKRGQSLQDIDLPGAPGSRYTLETFHQGQHHVYIKGMYPDTRVLYGLYFEAGRLAALLLDQDVTDFFRCEYAYRHKSGQWLQHGISPAREWVETRDSLGRDFYARVTHNDDEGMDVSEALEAATYLPLAAMVAPVYGAYLLAGGQARDEQHWQRPAEYRHRRWLISREQGQGGYAITAASLPGRAASKTKDIPCTCR